MANDGETEDLPPIEPTQAAPSAPHSQEPTSTLPLDPAHAEPQGFTEEAPFFASEPAPSAPAASDPVLDDLRDYSESIQGAAPISSVFVPYHLYLKGQFGPFERDRLLLFITENEIGISSQDLDLQIQAGKVFFPRISEYLGIKLIQDLRDSGLTLDLVPVNLDSDETRSYLEGNPIHFVSSLQPSGSASEFLQVTLAEAQSSQWKQLGPLELVQYVRADQVEAEKSELVQELLERMKLSLKNRAKLKGAVAMTFPEHELHPLRMPSQYQLLVRTQLLGKP